MARPRLHIAHGWARVLVRIKWRSPALVRQKLGQGHARQPTAQTRKETASRHGIENRAIHRHLALPGKYLSIDVQEFSGIQEHETEVGEGLNFGARARPLFAGMLPVARRLSFQES